ncbi:MAG: hypothetical protein JNL01_01090 [Bdellovibrionales bacterium]|nr:hypothetical protein [Bdellovibrionales bacterium]
MRRLSLGVYATTALLGLCLGLGSSSWAGKKEQDLDANFDRLDGTGKSGKRVDVIEWEGNLEVHVYPKGSLKGLGMKLDQKDGKKVMVISYSLAGAEKPLIRRAILGIPFQEGFQAYEDKTADDYDKIIVSNNGLAITKNLVAFKLDAAPTQLYPDEHPVTLAANEDTKEDTRKPAAAGLKPFADSFKGIPTSQKMKKSVPSDLVPKNWNQEQLQQMESGTKGGRVDPDSGAIRPFSW